MKLLRDLPICSLERDFDRALARGPVVITSPTGSGKSTWTPLWAAERGARVLVVEPRRVACRSLARFLARCRGSEPGAEVGYAVRHDDRIGPRTRVAYVTPGVALQMVGEAIDPGQTILLDEFHQRGIEIDLLLALLLARGHRRLGILSATLDGERVARHVDGTLLQAEGRQFPVKTRYLGTDPVPGGRHLDERVAGALKELEGAEGDVLVFLPGKAEIFACESRLRGRGEFVPVPLHGQLPPRQQDLAFEPSDRRRAILSTNVAETSVTLPWVRAVIDSGLVRRTTYREGRGALALTSIALDAAEQRAGRAGRLGPGECLRLWSASGKLEPRTPPEILREDLSQLCLMAARFGHRVEDLPWLDPPREFAVAEARSVLGSLGLFDEAGGLTPAGRQAGRLPLDPVLGRLLITGREEGVAQDMLLLVAAMSLGRPLFTAAGLARPEDGTPDPLTDPRCDVTALILALRDRELARGRVRPAAHAEARRVARQFARLLGVELAPPDAPVQRTRLAEAIVAALPASPFARRPRRDAWGNGRVEVVLGRESLIEEKARTILVVDQRMTAERGRRLKRIATCCMPILPARLRRLGAGQLRVATARIKGGQLSARAEWSIGTTVLERMEICPEGPAAREALVQLLRRGSLFPEAVAAAGRQLEAHNLRLVLEGADGAPAPELPAFLLRRLETLGFETGDDLPLLTDADLDPGLLTADELEQIDRRFPRALKVGALNLRITYDVPRRVITLRAGQTGRRPPRPDFLPRWTGWSVAFDDGKHTVFLRKRR